MDALNEKQSWVAKAILDGYDFPDALVFFGEDGVLVDGILNCDDLEMLAKVSKAIYK